MDIHEYQAKELLEGFGVAVPRGGLAYSPEQAAYRAQEIGGERWVVKAQVHTGARGKAGGIKLCKDDHEVAHAADELLGKRLVTAQTGPRGKLIHRLFVEEALPIERELYLGLVLDRKTERVMVVASAAGGMEIEEIAHSKPETIIRARMGIMPSHIYRQGRVGIVGRSGTLGYGAAAQMAELGIGVSTSVGIGGHPINGSSFRDILELFEADPATDAVVMIGEIGGPQEAEAAEFIRTSMKKPVVAYVAGLSAPKGRRMGHAGAIISAFGESAAAKVEILRDAGATVAPSPAELGTTVAATLKRAGLMS